MIQFMAEYQLLYLTKPVSNVDSSGNRSEPELAGWIPGTPNDPNVEWAKKIDSTADSIFHKISSGELATKALDDCDEMFTELGKKSKHLQTRLLSKLRIHHKYDSRFQEHIHLKVQLSD